MTQASMTIAVRGSGRIALDAQTCQLSPSIEVESEESAAEAAARVTTAVNQLSSRIEALAVDGVVGEWSVDRIRTWRSTRHYEVVDPDEDDEDDLEYLEEYTIYTAHVGMEVEFTEFGEAFEQFVADLMGHDDVSVGSIAWGLREGDQRAQSGQAYQLAVRDALAKATAIAQAVGADAPQPVSITESGVGGGPRPVPRMMAAASSLADGEDTALRLQPEKQIVAAEVEGTFVCTVR